MNCRNCGKAIEIHFGTFSKWIHTNGSIYCLNSMAEPQAKGLDFPRVRD